jgi:hypothetical protein
MVFLSCSVLLAACGRESRREAETAAAPVRQVVAQLSSHAKWRNGQGRCLCVGLFREEAVEDFPNGLLNDELSRHSWVRKWSDCAPYYARSKGPKGCEGGMTDYICSVANRTDMPSGTSRVLCHVAGQSKALQDEYLQDEYDVTNRDGAYSVRAVSRKAMSKLYD